ncbi:unnamed protein product [Ascophyllum nodosum]
MALTRRDCHLFLSTIMILAMFSRPGAPFLQQHLIGLSTTKQALSAGQTPIVHREGITGASPARMEDRPRLAGIRMHQQMENKSKMAEGVPSSHVDQAALGAARQRERTRKLSSVPRKATVHTDRFRMKKFHHVEFYCGDATTAASRFVRGLGMSLVAKSDQSTGNTQHASYAVKSNDLCFLFTAPYSLATAKHGGSREIPSDDVGSDSSTSSPPLPGFDPEAAHLFFQRHGMAGRAVGIEVEDAEHAYEQCTAHGAVGVQAPTRVADQNGRGEVVISEVRAVGDVVLRFISFESAEGSSGEGSDHWSFLPNFEDVPPRVAREGFGLQRLDHAVLNVWDLLESVDHLAGITGMHEFSEFSSMDVGTINSGLNSIVLANDRETVLLPLNEPTFGTAKKSQIQTFLEQNGGAGLQHLALKTDDILRTVGLMHANSNLGGFEFMEPPGPAYYRNVPNRIPSLTEDQLAGIEELGLLVDEDDEGTLIQIFTKPVGDRPTLFLEIIQRIGCVVEATGSSEEDQRDRIKVVPADAPGAEPVEMLQRPGCGGFGLGNFKALFESIENYETTLAVGE